jgi:hypothetical protein
MDVNSKVVTRHPNTNKKEKKNSETKRLRNHFRAMSIVALIEDENRRVAAVCVQKIEWTWKLRRNKYICEKNINKSNSITLL